MVESQILTVIRMWAAMAWADGVLAESEADGLRRLVATADLTAAERTQARTFIDTRTTLPETFLDMLKPDARRGIYRAACQMAVLDNVFATSERSLLARLRTQLGISDDLAREIEADVPGLAAID